MPHKKIKVKSAIIGVLLLTCTLHLFPVMAQESINTTGGNSSSNEGSVSFSIGQVVYSTTAGSNGSAAEGIQQSFEISVVSKIEEAKGIYLTISVYPNPATDYLILEVKDFELLAMTFQLFDMQGKLLQTQKITSHQTSIVMSNLAPGIYFVKVMQENKEVKTFKIIKN